MKISTFLDIIDPQRQMLLSDQIDRNRRFICDRRRNIKPKYLFKFVSTIHLDSSWHRNQEDQLRTEIASIPWNYIQKQGLIEPNNNYLDFTKEKYEVWKVKSYLTGLCQPL